MMAGNGESKKRKFVCFICKNRTYIRMAFITVVIAECRNSTGKPYIGLKIKFFFAFVVQVPENTPQLPASEFSCKYLSSLAYATGMLFIGLNTSCTRIYMGDYVVVTISHVKRNF